MSVLNPNPLMALQDGAGLPLNNGYIYVGAVNADPQANPIQLYWDAAMTAPAKQPLRTIYGRVYNNGVPGQVYCTGNYSIQVLDSQRVQVFYALNVAQSVDNPVPISQGGTGAQTAAGALANLGFITALIQQTYSAFTTSGSSSAFTLTPTPVITASPTNTRYQVTFHTSGAATPSLSINGLASKSLKQYSSTGVKIAAVIAANQISDVVDDGTDYLLLDPLAGGGGGSTGLSLNVRETVINGPVDTSNNPAWLVNGSALTVDITASPTVPVELAYALGYGSSGAIDSITQLNAAAVNQFGALLPNMTSYLSCDFLNSVSFTGSATVFPPQFDTIFNRGLAALCHFDGVNAATASIDDWGNTLTLTNATLSTAASRFGASSLLLNGTTAYADLSNNSFNSTGWTMECWFRRLGGLATNSNILEASNSAAIGVRLYIDTSNHIAMNLSSNGSTNNIGTFTGVTAYVVDGLFHHVAICYDPLAGRYLLYVDGVLATSTTNANQPNQFDGIRIGSTRVTPSSFFNGYIDEVRVSPFCAYPGGTSFAPPTNPFSVNQLGQLASWFDIQNMVMNEVTGPSTGGGVNPVFTKRTRLFVGEADTGGVSLSALRNYAYRGKYFSPLMAVPAAGTRVAMAANIGANPRYYNAVGRVRFLGQFAGWQAAMVADLVTNNGSNLPVDWKGFESPCVFSVLANGGGFVVPNTLTSPGTIATVPAGSGTAQISVAIDRGW